MTINEEGTRYLHYDDNIKFSYVLQIRRSTYIFAMNNVEKNLKVLACREFKSF